MRALSARTENVVKKLQLLRLMNQLSSIVHNSSPSKWYKVAAKTGLASKGVVYCLSGLLAIMAAIHFGNTSPQDAGKNELFGFVKEQPFGRILVLVIGIGLACYALWRWIEALKDTERKGSDKEGLVKRSAYFFNGLIYASLSYYAIRSFLGTESKGNDRQGWISRMLDQPYGQWLVGLVALILMVTGAVQIYRAASGKYKKYIRGALKNDNSAWLSNVGVAGYTARGVVWLIIGWLFMKAALAADASEAGASDSASAFTWLHDSSYGSLLLGGVGAGLICYGIFMFLRAKYQPIRYRS